MLKWAFIVLLIGMLVYNSMATMSEKQIKAAQKLVRNSCQSKIKISDEMIENIRKGKFSGDPIEKCYLHCSLTMVKISKKSGEMDYEASEAQVPQLPEARQAPTSASFLKCKDVELSDDKCDTAWRVAKCLYEDNPENYFVP